MKRLLTILILTLATTCWAEPASVAEGRRLFDSQGLGGSRKSCADCHPQGKGLHETRAYDDSQLREMINFCIRDAMQGTMLPLSDRRLDAILAYLRSLTPQ